VRCFQEKVFYAWKMFLIEILPHCDRHCTTSGTAPFKLFTNLNHFSEHDFVLCLSSMLYSCA
jgi:hypothetical protein